MPMEQEDDHIEEWSHMSDYDEFGLLPIEGEEESGPNIVKNDRAGTTSDVYDHDSTTHVDRESSAEETSESPTSKSRTNDEYPWFYLRNAEEGVAHEVWDNNIPWRSTGQMCFVRNWSTMDNGGVMEQRNKTSSQPKCQTINFFERGSTPKRRVQRRVAIEDVESDEDERQMVCTMTGQNWESSPFSIVIDSGACASVMPSGWRKHVPLQKTPQAESGEYFRAANGTKIYNEGQKCVSMMTREGAWRDMNLTVCDVAKALGSVSQMCRPGHTVVVNPPWHEDGSYIEYLDIGERSWMEESNGFYVLNIMVAPKQWQRTMRSSCIGQAKP